MGTTEVPNVKNLRRKKMQTNLLFERKFQILNKILVNQIQKQI